MWGPEEGDTEVTAAYSSSNCLWVRVPGLHHVTGHQRDVEEGEGREQKGIKAKGRGGEDRMGENRTGKGHVTLLGRGGAATEDR